MNLHGIVRAAITTVNPDIMAPWLQSSGNTVDAAGNATPTYTTTTIPIQVQAMTAQDLRQVNGMNLQGVLRSVYCYGNKQGVVRVAQKGGDILQFPEVPNPVGGTVRNWLVVKVVETWPDWSKCIVELQQ
jgi:hypothetical protein